MGIRLKEIYDRVNELGGLPAKIKFAKLTLVSSLDAEIIPDSPDNIAKFSRALAEIEALYRNRAPAASS